MLGMLVLLAGVASAQFGYSQDELDLFDLVEEVGVQTSFYEFIGVEPDASTKEIKSRYRKMAISWHPDKNDTENAADNFRMLAQVTETLKNSETRERYDRVLVEGLPNRMVRKMMKLSSFEVAVLLIITATTIHYCTMWGSYWEKKMILNDHIDAVSKRKKQKAAVEHLTAAKDQIEYPSFKNLLPFLVVKGVFYFFMAIPAAIKNYNEAKRIENERIQQEKDAAEQEEREIAEEKERREKHKVERLAKEKERKKREMERRAKQLKEIQELQAKKQQEEDELAALEDDLDDDHYGKKNKKKDENRPWSDDDYVSLTKLLSKYPGGTSNRWDRIANDLDRPVAEVIKKTKDAQKKMHTFNASGGNNRYSSATVVKTKRSVDVAAVGGISEATEKPESTETETDEWSQNQQKLLELGIKKYGKDVVDRWEKIAEEVVGKDKRQCMIRYKFLVEQIRKQKS